MKDSETNKQPFLANKASDEEEAHHTRVNCILEKMAPPLLPFLVYSLTHYLIPLATIPFLKSMDQLAMGFSLSMLVFIILPISMDLNSLSINLSPDWRSGLWILHIAGMAVGALFVFNMEEIFLLAGIPSSIGKPSEQYGEWVLFGLVFS